MMAHCFVEMYLYRICVAFVLYFCCIWLSAAVTPHQSNHRLQPPPLTDFRVIYLMDVSWKLKVFEIETSHPKIPNNPIIFWGKHYLIIPVYHWIFTSMGTSCIVQYGATPNQNRRLCIKCMVAAPQAFPWWASDTAPFTSFWQWIAVQCASCAIALGAIWAISNCALPSAERHVCLGPATVSWQYCSITWS